MGLLLLMLVGFSAPAHADEGPQTYRLDRVAAVVNDSVITLSEVYEFRDYIETEATTAQGREAAEVGVVDELIRRELINQEIARLDLDASDVEVDRYIDQVASQNNTDRDGLRAILAQQDVGWEKYRTEIKQQLRDRNFVYAVLKPRISISDDELQDEFRRSNANNPSVMRVQALFLAATTEGEAVSALARANELRAEALAGGDFAALSRLNDQGAFGAQDGEMGRFRQGELVPALDSALAETAVGGLTQPIVTAQGVFLLKVVEREAGGVSFAEARLEIEDRVFQQRVKTEQERWYQHARRLAAVRVLMGAEGTTGTLVPMGAQPADVGAAPVP